jgi:hypothetical protein
MVSSLEFPRTEALPPVHLLIAFMLAGLIPAVQDAQKVDPMPKAAGKWNVHEITAQGPYLVVVLNGEKTADVPVRAPIRLRRGQIPQAADQGAVER